MAETVWPESERPFDPERVIATIKRNWEGTPFWRLLGVTVEEVRPAYARLSMPARVDLDNDGGGGLHGGAIAALIDVAVTAVLWTVYDHEFDLRSHTTIELNASYLSPGFGVMTAEARGLRKGNSVFVGSVDVVDEKGIPVATGRATYRVWLNR
jgi:uncharacterized protein (TIGR00369 family)